MGEQKGYQPSPEEIQKAEEMLTAEEINIDFTRKFAFRAEIESKILAGEDETISPDQLYQSELIEVRRSDLEEAKKSLDQEDNPQTTAEKKLAEAIKTGNTFSTVIWSEIIDKPAKAKYKDLALAFEQYAFYKRDQAISHRIFGGYDDSTSHLSRVRSMNLDAWVSSRKAKILYKEE